MFVSVLKATAFSLLPFTALLIMSENLNFIDGQNDISEEKVFRSGAADGIIKCWHGPVSCRVTQYRLCKEAACVPSLLERSECFLHGGSLLEKHLGVLDED